MGKKIDIESLLHDTYNHKIIYTETPQSLRDQTLTTLLSTETNNEVYYVGTPSFILSYYEEQLNNNAELKWKIKCLFQLGHPFIFPHNKLNMDDKGNITITDLRENSPNEKLRQALRPQTWYLYVLSKEDVATWDSIISFNDYNKPGFYEFNENNLDLEDSFYLKNEADFGKPIALDINQNDSTYFHYIESAIETNEIPDRHLEFELQDFSSKSSSISDIYAFEFNKIPNTIIMPLYFFYPCRYRKSVIQDFGLPSKKESLEKLNSIVQIIKPKDNSFNVKKGDVIINELRIYGKEKKVVSNISVADSDYTIPAYGKTILRSFTLSPYYIWTYLESDFFKDYILLRSSTKPDDIILIDAEKIHILITENVNDKYFQKKYELSKNNKTNIQKKADKNTFYDQNAYEIIKRDLIELRNCFNTKSYKAAIILAGSILEAFLIDWLSEIKDVDYFNKQYMVYRYQTGKEERAGLSDYINEIKSLKKPYWNGAADKAHKIRDKRNLVHAKLYISEKEVSKETCTEVINYLEYVINTRWK